MLILFVFPRRRSWLVTVQTSTLLINNMSIWFVWNSFSVIVSLCYFTGEYFTNKSLFCWKIIHWQLGNKLLLLGLAMKLHGILFLTSVKIELRNVKLQGECPSDYVEWVVRNENFCIVSRSKDSTRKNRD